jgi:hypothetical protein
VPTATRVEDIPTSRGLARAHHFAVPHGVPRASLVLGHGAGAGPHAPDLSTLAAGLPVHGIEVVLAEQPWHVAGRPVAPHRNELDAAWIEIVAALRRSGVGLRRLAVGGRSSGARVACRTVATTKPAAVLCLAYPLRPGKDRPDRGSELAAAAEYAPTTVIQGTRARFGGPPEIASAVATHGQRVLAVAVPFCDHSFHLAAGATITDYEARMVLIEAALRAVLRLGRNSGPLLER